MPGEPVALPNPGSERPNPSSLPLLRWERIHASPSFDGSVDLSLLNLVEVCRLI